MADRTCIVDHCERKVASKGLCALHYGRKLRLGTVELPERPSLNARFMTNVEVDGSTGCWLWTAKLNRDGYGHFRLDGRRPGAHRVAYELFVGAIPEGLEIDHLCRVRHCVNPAHLEPVTHGVNVARGIAVPPVALAKARQTHCIHGHEFTAENTLVKPNGTRGCRACVKLRNDKRQR